MGHRRNRKRGRKTNQYPDVNGDALAYDPGWMLRTPSPRGPVPLIPSHHAEAPEPAPKTCAGCREFVEDQEGGRGTCLHPGSGVLSPWTDTDACAFYMPQRSTRLAR